MIVAQFVKDLFVATATPFHPESNLFVSVSVLSLYFCIFVFSVLMVFFVSVRESSLFVATPALLRPESNLFFSVSVLLFYYCIFLFNGYFVSVRELSLFVATRALVRPRSNLTKGLAQQ